MNTNIKWLHKVAHAKDTNPLARMTAVTGINELVARDATINRLRVIDMIKPWAFWLTGCVVTPVILEYLPLPWMGLAIVAAHVIMWKIDQRWR